MVSFFVMYDLLNKKNMVLCFRKLTILGILFRQIAMFIKFCVAFVFGFQSLQSIDFSKTYQLKGLEPKIQSHTNFYQYCDLTKNYI